LASIWDSEIEKFERWAREEEPVHCASTRECHSFTSQFQKNNAEIEIKYFGKVVLTDEGRDSI
jgi:hypothetical protein